MSEEVLVGPGFVICVCVCFGEVKVAATIYFVGFERKLFSY
jgi:hypothetical protein